VILDIADPAHPQYLGRTNAPASHSAAIGRGGDHAGSSFGRHP
jgi:hypothetical protein